MAELCEIALFWLNDQTYVFLSSPQAIEQINRWASADTPFFFLWDFECQRPFLCPLAEAASENVYFQMEFHQNTRLPKDAAATPSPLHWEKQPVSLNDYRYAFLRVQEGLRRGDSYLTNLTFPTVLRTNYDLLSLFYQAKARFKLYFKDRFVSFSPEPFVRIEGDRIATFPMKGTIDAALPNAAESILNDRKEAAEHATIVDLLRNDLSQIAKKVRVSRYRYLEKVQTNERTLLQVSSEISGTLPSGFRQRLGDHFFNLLPAGSVSGAPKTKTCQIIREAEGMARGYFTGVFGYFDGKDLESAVLIRFVEKEGGNLRFRSGGGITAGSVLESEYEEMIQKVYAPIP